MQDLKVATLQKKDITHKIHIRNTDIFLFAVATLMFGTLENAVKRLFSRDTHLQFGFGSLLTMLVIYFLLICWATGTSVASGALVPML